MLKVVTLVTYEDLTSSHLVKGAEWRSLKFQYTLLLVPWKTAGHFGDWDTGQLWPEVRKSF